MALTLEQLHHRVFQGMTALLGEAPTTELQTWKTKHAHVKGVLQEQIAKATWIANRWRKKIRQLQRLLL